MNVLIVHAHHEPQSFSSALKDRAVATLTRLGHTVDVSDLHAMGFDPLSDRRNFTTVANPSFLKQQLEEKHATDTRGFAPDLDSEMKKVLRADLLIFNFPLWWFGMPAALKGWVDRVFASGKMYGDGKLYENGFGRGKRALVTMTTGSGRASFNGFGYNPSMRTTLAPIHHGIFWFNGFAPLQPFIAYAAARAGDDGRAHLLDDYDRYLSTLNERQPIVLPSLGDFDADRVADSFGRWMVEARNARGCDEARIEELQRGGEVLEYWCSSESESEPIAWLVLRAKSRVHAETIVREAICDVGATFVIRELAQPGKAAPALASSP